MTEEKKKVRKRFLPYTNDIIAKCLFIGDDENSSYIRNSNCEVALDNGKKIVYSRVLNVELLPTASGNKMIKMDIRAQDEYGNLYNIEIQNHYKPVDFNRWEWYGAKNLTSQLKEGEYYDEIKPEYQLIITNFKGEANRRNKRLINRYVMKNEDGEVEQEHALINRTYINLSRIDEIVKEKDPEKITDYENMCYLFKHNKSYDKIKPGKLVKAIMKKYEELKRDDKVWTLAEKIQEAEAREQYLLKESKKEGELRGERKY